MKQLACTLILAAVLGAVGASAAAAQDGVAASGEMTAVPAASVAWADRVIPGFDPGMKLAVVNGNPGEAGPYVVRLSFPDGYRFPPHWHPMTENVTVLSGTFIVAMGSRVDDSKLKSYGAGSYLHIPGTHPHFGGARGATVIQLHGEGPFSINLVEGTTK